ncbi:MAG: NAD(P)/FAD-dependent oxidoreductase [Bacteroidota bacterium]
MNREEKIYDIIILGAGLAGSFLCLSLLKRNPDFKILMLEKSDSFPQKIGESIVDVSALFVKSLGLDNLLDKHTPKSGLRFLFNENNSSDPAQTAEFASPTPPGLIEAYHLDRKVFDEDLLEEVVKRGADVLRPANILQSSFEEFNSQLELEVRGEIHKVRSPWLIDATGRSRYLPKILGWKDKKIRLNTGAIMAHFKNIAPNEIWDTVQKKDWAKCSIGHRKYSTMHLMREYAWWWIIRLDEELTSIGVVFDKNEITFEDHEKFFLQQIAEDVQLSLITQDAERGEIRHVAHVPYVSEKLYDHGIALIGESGAFLDPFVSPGIEMIGQQCLWLSELLDRDKKSGKFEEKAWKRYEKIFQQAYKSRLRIYEEAYAFMNSYDIFSNWIMQGNFMYFVRVVYPAVIFKNRLKYPLRFTFIEKVVLNYFSNRFQEIYARRKLQNRVSNNKHHRISYSGVGVPKGPRFLLIPFILLIKPLIAYLSLELKELRYFLGSRFKPFKNLINVNSMNASKR